MYYLALYPMQRVKGSTITETALFVDIDSERPCIGLELIIMQFSGELVYHEDTLSSTR